MVRWLLVGLAVVLFFGGALLLLFHPMWWGWCIGVLDMRKWMRWEWVGIGAAVSGALVLIRIRPEGRRREAALTPGPSPDQPLVGARRGEILDGLPVASADPAASSEPQGRGRRKWRIRSLVLDGLLCAAVVGLLVQIAWPAIRAYRNRPRPGVQVCQQYLGKPGEQKTASNAGIAIDYLFYLPREYRLTPGKQWPLVVFLHGIGERGQDLEMVRRAGLAKRVELGTHFDFILASPQCPKDRKWEPERVVQLIEHLGNTFSVDRDRVYLTGFSMGGYGTWATACQHPEHFAAIAPLAGGGDTSQAERLKGVPIWAFHGKEDKVVQFDRSQSMVDAVRKAGGQVEFTVYPDAGHGICDLTYENPRLYEWLLAQRRVTPPVKENAQSPAE